MLFRRNGDEGWRQRMCLCGCADVDAGPSPAMTMAADLRVA